MSDDPTIIPHEAAFTITYWMDQCAKLTAEKEHISTTLNKELERTRQLMGKIIKERDAERERCAGIADKAATLAQIMRDYSGMRVAASIADAIRNPDERAPNDRLILSQENRDEQ